MNKTFKKIIVAFIISSLTLAAGYGVCLLSFCLFDELSPGEMRLLFAVDITALCLAGVVVYFFFERKNAKSKRKAQYQKRHAFRTQRQELEYGEIEKIINCAGNNFVA